MFYPCILILDKTFRPLNLVSSHCFAMCAWQQHMLDVLSSLWCCTKVTHCSHYACELLNEMFESMCRRLVHVHVVPPTVAQLFSPIYLHIFHLLFFRFLNFLSSCWSIWAQLSKIDRHSAILFKYCVFCSFWSKIEQIMPAPSNPPFHICFFCCKLGQKWARLARIRQDMFSGAFVEKMSNGWVSAIHFYSNPDETCNFEQLFHQRPPPNTTYTTDILLEKSPFCTLKPFGFSFISSVVSNELGDYMKFCM